MISNPLFDLLRCLFSLHVVVDSFGDDDSSEMTLKDVSFFDLDKIANRWSVGDDYHLRCCVSSASSVSLLSFRSMCSALTSYRLKNS
jgi:hypothetical protein